MQTMTFRTSGQRNGRQGVALADAPILLRPGKLASMGVLPGQRVECRRGSVWITVDNGGHDYVLNAGNRLAVKVRGCMVIEALMPSEVRLLPRVEATTDHAERKSIMKLINKTGSRPGILKIRSEGLNKDSVASALALAASLLILVFASATAAVQASGAGAVPVKATVKASVAPSAGTQALAERVFANIERNPGCHHAKLC